MDLSELHEAIERENARNPFASGDRARHQAAMMEQDKRYPYSRPDLIRPDLNQRMGDIAFPAPDQDTQPRHE